MAEHNEIGKEGEKLAADYLLHKGYKIIEKNYRFKHAEVDIIAEKDNLLVVVEVKTRQSEYMAGPEITVTRSKQKSIIKVANEYIITTNCEKETRFDIISILLNQKETKIEHLEDAFYPTL